MRCPICRLHTAYNNYIATAPLRIRSSNSSNINIIGSKSSFSIDPKVLFTIENEDDLYVLIIPMDRVSFTKKDFTREYKLDFYKNGFRCDVAYLCSISKDTVVGSNLFTGYDGADSSFQSTRQYFYDINGNYYAIELHGRYLSFSENQSKSLADILNNQNQVQISSMIN